MDNNVFDAPPEGAVPHALERALPVQYKSNKTPENYAHLAQGDALAQYVENCALGFHYYDKEVGKRIPLANFTFVVLEVYAGISGYLQDTKTSYWSNRVKDTRTDPLIVYSSAQNGQIAKGLYRDIKESLPAGASYTKFVRAYCLQLERVIEIELTAASERGMQKAIAAAEEKAGRKMKWEKVFILSLAANDHLWGFNLTGYNRETKDGADYPNPAKGELYLSPIFNAGIVNPVKSPELHNICVAAQDAERQAHEAYKAKHANAAQPATQQAPEITAPMPEEEPAEIDDLPF